MIHLIKRFAAALLVLPLFLTISSAATNERYLSPAAMVATKDGQDLYIACATANQIQRVNLTTLKVVSAVQVPASPSGLALSPDGTALYVTCATPEGTVCVVDLKRNKVIDQIRVGHTPVAPVVAPDGRTLFVCNRFDNDIGVIDLVKRKQVRRIPVQREPMAAALTLDGKFLLVANLLPVGRADVDIVAAVVSVIDVVAGKVAKELRLPNGSGSLNDIRVSPDGKYAALTHILARFHLPATQVDRGWMNANALTLIDLSQMGVLNTVLVDDSESGAANPWGLDWSADGSKLAIAHAGTHEISLVNFPGLLAKLEALPGGQERPASGDYGPAPGKADASHDLSFLVGLRQRIKLTGEKGPRALLVTGSRVYSGNYFSDTLAYIDLTAERPTAASIPLGPKSKPSLIRKGESYFNDADLCFQGWQSCASCHPGEARVDALNWDLLNDGIGNPKNNKSLLLSHRTPPAMSLGVRDTAETAVRSGIKFILFSQQPEEVAVAMDEYLKSLKPVPSPFLVRGKLSDKARRGEKVFSKAGCMACHPPGIFTDLKPYDVGTRGPYDDPEDKFDTPTLIEIWRTAPYLNNGSAATIRDVVTTHNSGDRHGTTSQLTSEEIGELCEYLLSL